MKVARERCNLTTPGGVGHGLSRPNPLEPCFATLNGILPVPTRKSGLLSESSLKSEKGLRESIPYTLKAGRLP